MKFLFDFIATIWVIAFLAGLDFYTIKTTPEQAIVFMFIVGTVASFVWLFFRKILDK